MVCVHLCVYVCVCRRCCFDPPLASSLAPLPLPPRLIATLHSEHLTFITEGIKSPPDDALAFIEKKKKK